MNNRKQNKDRRKKLFIKALREEKKTTVVLCGFKLIIFKISYGNSTCFLKKENISVFYKHHKY